MRASRLVQAQAACADRVGKARLDRILFLGCCPRLQFEIARIGRRAVECETDLVVELEAALVRFGEAALPKLCELDRIRDLERRADGLCPARREMVSPMLFGVTAGLSGRSAASAAVASASRDVCDRQERRR